MKRNRRQSSWADFFGNERQGDGTIGPLIKQRASLMQKLSAVEKKAAAGDIDVMEIHCVMLALNCFDQVIIIDDTAKPEVGYRKVLEQT